MAHSQVNTAFRLEIEDFVPVGMAVKPKPKERVALSAIHVAALAGRDPPAAGAGSGWSEDFKDHVPLGKIRRPDSDDDMPSGRSTPKEETATDTTRSATNSLDDSSDQTPRSMSKSGDSVELQIPSDADDEPPEDEHDDYYEFLRDFAGSFDADEEEEDDDEDEDDDQEVGPEEKHDSGELGKQDGDGERATPPVGRKRSIAFSSEEELADAQPLGRKRSASSSSEDELPDTQPLGRKRSSAFSSEEDISDNRPIGRKRSSAFSSEEEVVNCTLGSSHPLDPLTIRESDTGSGPGNAAKQAQENNEDTKMPPNEGADDSVAAGRTQVAEEKEGLHENKPLPEDHRVLRDGLTTPSRDHRGAVVDNYDVVLAVRDYAQQRLGDRAHQMREDVAEALRLKRAQARRLLKPAGNPRSDPHIRAHYAHVRHELLIQARGLEAWLVQADRALENRARQVAARGPCTDDVNTNPASP